MALACWLLSACCLWISLEMRLLIPSRYSSRSNFPAASGILGKEGPSGGQGPPGPHSWVSATGGRHAEGLGTAEAWVPGAAPGPTSHTPTRCRVPGDTASRLCQAGPMVGCPRRPPAVLGGVCLGGLASSGCGRGPHPLVYRSLDVGF